MDVNIYEDGEYREWRNFEELPAVGDEIAMLKDGEPMPFKVERVYRSYDLENKQVQCMEVQYNGNGYMGVY